MIGRDGRFLFGSLSRAPVVIVCAGFSAFVLALCVFAGLHFKNRVEQEYYRQTENIAQVLMASFENDAATADAILGRLASDIAESEVSTAHQSELHRLLSGYTLQPSMRGPAILDRDGTLIASAVIEPVPPLSLKDRGIFRAHPATSQQSTIYISTPVRLFLTDEWAIQFSRPMRDSSGRLYGVVLLSYQLSHFIRLYEKLKLSDRGLASLVGKDGVVRVRSLSGQIDYGSTLSSAPLVYDRVRAGETSGTFYGSGAVDNVTRIGTFLASQTTPFYVTVGYDSTYLRDQYSGFLYALGLFWLALTASMIGVSAFIRRLGKLHHQTQLEIINSAVAERQKISADMHDSIGASLAALLATFATENVNMDDVKRRTSEILMELRLLVDGTDTDEGDINSLLSNVRHRMGPGFELVGIDLHWDVDELPSISALTARDTLAIKLILMEALSNVLHHSHAKHSAVTARYDQPAAAISISVQDDGRGFDATAARAGRGLSNIRKRIASISTGAELVIDASPGHGTTVRISLRALASNG
jgi:signal transduction histidine kinase